MANQSEKGSSSAEGKGRECEMSDICWVPCKDGRISEGRVHGWVPFGASACLPANAVVGGSLTDGTVVYVGRAIHNGFLLPGRVEFNEKCAYVSQDTEHKKTQFEILTGNIYKWLPGSRGQVPPNSVDGGFEDQTLYIGRGRVNGALVVGKVHPGKKCLYVPLDGKEHALEYYEVLTYSTPFGDWIDVDDATDVYSGAVIGGHDSDGSVMYVGRAIHNTEHLPGRVMLTEKCGYFGTERVEHKKTEFDILTGSNFKWLPGSNGSIPPNAVIGGRRQKEELLYVGRGHVQGVLVVGKVHQAGDYMYVPFDGTEHRLYNYEVLTYSTPAADATSPISSTCSSITWTSGNNLPDEALLIDCGTQSYVGRALHYGNLLPAVVFPEKRCAYVCYNGKIVEKSKFDVLVDSGFDWESAENGYVPPNALEGGRTAKEEPLYIGRIRHFNCSLMGTVQQSHGCMYAAIAGQQASFKSYEVLVCKAQLEPRSL